MIFQSKSKEVLELERKVDSLNAIIKEQEATIQYLSMMCNVPIDFKEKEKERMTYDKQQLQ